MAGSYLIRYDQDQGILLLSRISRESGGGSHVNLWASWHNLVGILLANASKDPIEYASAIIDLSNHRNFLELSTGRYRPSELRGEINYQFKGGTWNFESNSNVTIRRVQMAIRESSVLGIANTHSADGLIANNRLIIDLAKAAFLHIADVSSKSISRYIANRFSALFS